MYDDYPSKDRQKRQKRRKMKQRSASAKALEENQFRNRIIQDKRNRESWAWMDEALEDYYNGTQDLGKRTPIKANTTSERLLDEIDDRHRRDDGTLVEEQGKEDEQKQ